MINIQDGVRRTGGSHTLYMRFLKQFPTDPSMRALHAALDAGDLSSAFLCAHTLKGLSAQLGISSLCEPAEALCELLRPLNPAALDAARAQCRALRTLYDEAVREIDAL